MTEENRPVAEARGRIVTHGALLERVPDKAHREDVEYLRIVIRALRLKIAADPAQPRLLRNESRFGCRLETGEAA